MKKLLSFLIILLLLSCQEQQKTTTNSKKGAISNMSNKKQKLLRHVVLFKFKDVSDSTDIQKIEDAFKALPSKIPQIRDFEWGINNSPEGLDKGFTHCFFVSFHSEEDRAVYLPHPDHLAFVEVLSPHLEDVLVIDYWTE